MNISPSLSPDFEWWYDHIDYSVIRLKMMTTIWRSLLTPQLRGTRRGNNLGPMD